MIFRAIINDVQLILIFNLSLLVCRNKIDFCMLTFYLKTSVNLLVSSISFIAHTLGFSRSQNRYILFCFLFFLICIAVVPFPALLHRLESQIGD